MSFCFVLFFSAVILAMIPTKIQASTHFYDTSDAIEMHKSDVRHRLGQELRDHANQYISFMEDFLDYVKSDQSETFLISGTLGIERNIHAGQNILKLVDDVMGGFQSVNDVLGLVLKTRIDYIARRGESHVMMRSDVAQRRAMGGSTSGFLYIAPTKPDNFDALSHQMQMMAKSSTDTYQFMNRMIRGFYKMTNPLEMSEENIRLIRLSPKLWPILSGESEDYGYPDDAILIYDEDPKDKQTDYEFYRKHYELSQNVPQLAFVNRKRTTKIVQMTPFERSQKDSNYTFYKQIPDLPYPDWLRCTHQHSAVQSSSVDKADQKNNRVSNDVKTAHIPLKKNNTKSTRSNSKKKSQKNLQKKKVLSKKSVNVQKNYDRDSLKEASKTSENAIHKVTKSLDLMALEPDHGDAVLHHDSSAVQALEYSLEEVALKDKVNDMGAEMSRSTELKRDALSRPRENPEVLVPLSFTVGTGKLDNANDNHDSEIIVADDVGVTSDKMDNADLRPRGASRMLSTSSSQYLAPRGMRLFHSHDQVLYRSLIQPGDLKGKHEMVLFSIFDVKQFISVSYGDFARLWRHINGEKSINESKGSSHKSLLDADGRVVAGTFSHGDAMTYSRRTIPYIRDALIRIGFGL